MCGIAGYMGVRGLPKSAIEGCLKAMRHRGPDHQAWRHWTGPKGLNVYLLHARLSIIDLDPRANQPFGRDGHWLAYNGELYNYRELRPELQALGCDFETESDTEVLLQVINRLGWDGLDRCEGMWAFAHYNENTGTLTLCRDRFGEKPLYLYRDKTGLYFASEIKFLARLAGRRFTVNRNQLHRYLVNGYKSLYKQPENFFQQVEEVPRANCFHVAPDGTCQRRTYWTFEAEPDKEMSYEHAVETARELLIDAVRIRLRSDVPLAFCMSGGVDSNALIGIAKRVLDHDAHGFTIVNDDPRYNETEMVDLAVAEMGIRHTSIPLETNDFLPRLRALVRQHDAPVYTITYYVHWLLQQSIAAHGYRISISGTAADELFSGYYDHHLFYLHAVRNEPAAFKEAVANWTTYIKPTVRNPFLKDPRVFIDNPGQRQHIYLNADEFSRFLVEDWHEAFREEAYTPHLMQNRMLNELFHEIVPAILHEDDHNAMACSVENRSPFLDRRLFEFCFRIAPRHLVRDGYAKAVLRDAMRGIVPDAILNSRRKVGFNAPIFSLLDVGDPEVRGYLLDDGPAFRYVRRDKVEALIAKKPLLNSESKFLFYFLAAKIFLEEFAS